MCKILFTIFTECFCSWFQKWYRFRIWVPPSRGRAIQLHDVKDPRGGTWIIFWGSVRPEVWNPYPYLRIFFHSKNGWIDSFFEIFANRDPFLRVFCLKNGWFYNFFANFLKWDPPPRIFLTKVGPMSKDFWWKSNPFGRHIPVCLNMWVPPRERPFMNCFCYAIRLTWISDNLGKINWLLISSKC